MESSWGLSVSLYLYPERASDKVTFEQRPKGNQGVSHSDTGGRVFHAEGMAGAQALRWTCMGRPAWLEQSKTDLRTISGHTATGKGQSQSPFQVGRIAHAKASGKTNALCFSTYFTSSDP